MPKWNMKKDNFFSRSYLFKPFLSALMLGLSRLPLHLGFLVFFGFIPLLSFFAEKPSVKRTIFAALTFSTVYTAVTLHWISLVTVGGFLGMFILFGLYFSILFVLINVVQKKLPKMRFSIFVTFWMSFEYLQNFGEFRFPWFDVGYSLSDFLVLLQLADIGGIYLLSVLIITANILIYRASVHPKKNILILFILSGIWFGYGIWRLQTLDLEQRKEKVAIVQVSIPQHLKWKKSYVDTTLALYSEYTKKAAEEKPKLVILPESAIPAYVEKQTGYKNFVKNLARENHTNIFLGFPHYETAKPPYPFRFKFYNAATEVDSTGKFLPLYYKNILVPFGERIPFLKVFPFLWKLNFGQANWEYGKKQAFYEINGLKFSPLICFEIAFPELTAKMVRHNVDFIVNITNDAWFKKSAGTYQHAMMTKFRAVETRKQIFRAANTGYSLIISPTGKILKKIGLYEKNIISDNILICEKKSVFTKYLYRFPLVFVLGAGFFVVIFFLKIWMIR